MGMGGYGEIIAAGINATQKDIAAGREIWYNLYTDRMNKAEGERIAKMQRDLLMKQLSWQKLIQGAEAQKERFAKDISMVDRAEGKQQAEKDRSYQMSRQKMGDVLNMINRNPELRARTISNIQAIQGRGF